MKRSLIACLLLLLPMAAFVDDFDAPAPEGLRPPRTLGTVMPAPKIAEQAEPIRQARHYPEQPPVIPHSIRGYQVDRFFNKCLSCPSTTGMGKRSRPFRRVVTSAPSATCRNMR